MTNKDKFWRLQKAAKLSNSQVAQWFRVEITAVKRWRNGTTEVPESVIMALSYRVKYGPDYAVDVSNVNIDEPVRLTRKVIVDAVCANTGVKPEYVSLERFSDGDAPCYVWTGKAGACFLGAETYSTLNAVSFDRWIDDFNGRLKEWYASREHDTNADIKVIGARFNEHIAAIDWVVE